MVYVSVTSMDNHIPRVSQRFVSPAASNCANIVLTYVMDNSRCSCLEQKRRAAYGFES